MKDILVDTNKTDDASHVYRGYRKQLLFVLYKILTKGKGYIFCPEGIEDFAIKAGDKVESIYQVKDYKKPLVISDLSSGKNSFIKRSVRHMEQYPSATISLVYFGTLGKELLGVAENNKNKIKTVAKKVSATEKISIDDAETFLNKVQFQDVSEQELTKAIETFLFSSQLGLDVENSKDLFFWWLFRESEKKGHLTYDSVIAKIQNIGSFVKERAMHHEWLGSIIPFQSQISNDVNIQRLKSTYLEGISATMDHINKNMDIVREEKLNLVQEKFKKNNILIIRGASGQGKTSLALRYFLDFFPLDLSYQMREPENRSHAYSMAEAIIKHHEAFDMPLYIYYDVNMTDNQWPYVIERFSNYKNVHLLVTIRNEDWQRSNIIINEKISFEEIELNFSKDEAENLFKNVPQTSYLNFKDSWSDFGGKGPLLEYIYLLNNGKKLEDRLSAQIERIKSESNNNKDDAELKILQIIAMANSYGARVEIKKLRALKMLPSPELLLKKFNQEYLIKISDDNKLVEGFHPIRSQILCSELFDEVFHSWISVLPETLEAIEEEDIESFFLHTFHDRNENTIKSILNTLLSFSPNKWVGYNGIIKALLWLGIKQYADQNRKLVEELKVKEPSLDFRMALDIDIGNTSSDYKSVLKNFIQNHAPAAIPTISYYQSKQTSKKEVFVPVKTWMSKTKSPPLVLSTEKDFLSLCETAFWYGHLDVKTDIFNDIEKDVDENFERLSLQTKAEMVFGLFSLKNDALLNIIKKHEKVIFDELTKAYGILYLEEDNDRIKANYILELDDNETCFLTSKEENNNAKSMSIIELLQKFYPSKEYYCTQGYGADMLKVVAGIPQKYNHDDTFKEISKKNLPSPYLTQLNSTFIGYLQYRYRPSTWQEYVDKIILIREQLIVAFQEFIFVVKRYYKKQKSSPIVNSETDSILNYTLGTLRNKPSFPMVAVDIWGFSIDETSSQEVKENDENVSFKKLISLQKYDKYQKNCRYLFAHCTNFFNQLSEIIVNRIKGGKDDNYISLSNILDANIHLVLFQEEFRKNFSNLCAEKLDQLEKKENKLYSRMFFLWFFFCFYPDKKISEIIGYSEKQIKMIYKNNALASLGENLKNADVNYTVREAVWEGNNTLWIIGDFLQLSNLGEEDYSKIGSHFSCDFFKNAWEKSIEKFNRQQLTYLFKYYWNDVRLIFTCKHKLIFTSMIKMNVLSLLSEDSHPWNIPIGSDSLRNIPEVNGYWKNEQIDIVQNWYQAFIKLRIVLNHLIELIKVLDKNEHKSNEQLIRSYLLNQMKKSGDVFQEFLDSFSELGKMMEERLTEDSICIELYKEVVGNYRSFFPDPNQETDGYFECRISTEDLPGWRKRIDDNSDMVSLLYEKMLFDAIDNEVGEISNDKRNI